jgi:predicted outer membrane repeat protein
MKGATFKNNQAYLQGGAIYAKSFKSVEVGAGTSFSNNNA